MNSEYVHEFNSLLSGEISAVETYDLALQKNFDGTMIQDLNKCRASHADRVTRLTQYVIDAGGKAASGSGPWGVFAAWAEKATGSEKIALSVLEQLEAERLVQYENQRTIVPKPVLIVIDEVLLPAQHETHLVLSSRLKEMTALPS